MGRGVRERDRARAMLRRVEELERDLTRLLNSFSIMRKELEILNLRLEALEREVRENGGAAP